MATPHPRRRIYLLRHGHVRYQDQNGKLVADPDQVPLSEKGRAQADAAGLYLKSTGVARFDKVVSSSLPRTIETATRALAAHGQGGAPEPWPELREIKGGHGTDGGRWSSSPQEMAEILASFSRLHVPLETRWMGGETAGEACDRVLPALERLLADDTWETALLALHNMVNVVILSHVLTGGRAYLGALEQNFGCINVLDVGAGRDWIVRALNICPVPEHYERTRFHSLEIMAAQAGKPRP